MKNTSLPTLLIVSIIAFSLISCGGGSSSKKSATPTGGAGGTGDPITYTCTDTNYEPVHDVASLKAISDNMAGDYCLAKDIDLAGVTSGFPLGWTSNTDITKFTGNFDGEGRTISNLVIDGGGGNLGLFSKIDPEAGKSSEIKNLNLNNFRVTGKGYVGALAGQANDSVIISVKINDAMINGTIYVGGLMGSINGKGSRIIDSAVISNSYGTSDISGVNHVGGLVGEMLYGGVVSGSYATGAVKGESKVGGLIGKIHIRGEVLNSYATGEVTATGTGANKGGLIGELYYCTADGCSVTNSYFDKSTNSGINAIGVTTGTGNPTIIGLVGVNGASDIGVAAGGGFQTIASPNSKIFVDWNKDKDIWQIMAGAWPTFLHSK